MSRTTAAIRPTAVEARTAATAAASAIATSSNCGASRSAEIDHATVVGHHSTIARTVSATNDPYARRTMRNSTSAAATIEATLIRSTPYGDGPTSVWTTARKYAYDEEPYGSKMPKRPCGPIGTPSQRLRIHHERWIA